MKKLVLGIVLLFGINAVNAQSDMVQLLAADIKDANKLISDYASPFLETFGNNLNNGWYSTAAPLKTGRFTITIGGTASFVPKDKQSFTIDPANYTNIRTTGNVPITAPTVFGGDTPIKNLYAYYNDGGTTIKTPIELKGTGINMSPLPIVQLSVGLIKGTEVMLRIFPKLDLGDYKAGYLGIGLKHDIKQWLPFMSKLPFELSFIGAYTSASFDMIGNDFLKVNDTVFNPKPSTDYKNQAINFSSKAWNANLVISKKLSLLTLFGGVRLSHYKTTLELKGNFPITIKNNGINEIKTLTDPIGFDVSGTHIGFNGGLRIKLGFLAIFAEGSLVPGGYSSATAGLNIGFFN